MQVFNVGHSGFTENEYAIEIRVDNLSKSHNIEIIQG